MTSDFEKQFLEINNRSNVHFAIIHNLGSLLLMYSATKEKIDSFPDDIGWYDKNAGRRENKHRMKETSRMQRGYEQKLNELIIIGVAKSIEDTLYDLAEKLRIKIDFWKDCNSFLFFKEMKTLRNLNNCIKHSKGIIKRGHKANDSLIDNDGFEENAKIESLNLNLESIIMNAFGFLMDIFWDKDVRDNPYSEIKNDTTKIKGILIPDFMSQ